MFVSRQRNRSQLCIPRKPRKIGVWVSGAEIPNLSGGYHNCGFWVRSLRKCSKSFWGKLGTFLESLPKGLKSWKNPGFEHEIEIFKRWNEWHFQARLKISSEPSTKPPFLWGNLKVKIEHFKRDWSFQRDWKFQAEARKFQAFKWDCFIFKIRALWVRGGLSASSV